MKHISFPHVNIYQAANNYHKANELPLQLIF